VSAGSLTGRVLITGATGFIGRHLQDRLKGSRREYRVAARSAPPRQDFDFVVVGDIGPQTDWQAALRDVDSVVHLAGRAHVLRETAADPRAEFMRVNAAATGALASAARRAGVRRIVYVSSVGVLGNSSPKPLNELSSPRPHNAYAESKLAGEIALRENAGSETETVVVRPPLVYGDGVGANFLRLLRWVDGGVPLPLGSVDNRRSMVNVWNLCDFIVRLLDHPQATQRTWLVSDDEVVSTPDLVRAIARSLGKPARLLSFPPRLLAVAGAITGMRNAVTQLCGSLELDIGASRRELDWSPPVRFEEGLRRTTEWFRATRAAAS
jgi:nucleoside-diphosphate-sugar epimerase